MLCISTKTSLVIPTVKQRLVITAIALYSLDNIIYWGGARYVRWASTGSYHIHQVDAKTKDAFKAHIGVHSGPAVVDQAHLASGEVLGCSTHHFVIKSSLANHTLFVE